MLYFVPGRRDFYPFVEMLARDPCDGGAYSLHRSEGPAHQDPDQPSSQREQDRNTAEEEPTNGGDSVPLDRCRHPGHHRELTVRCCNPARCNDVIVEISEREQAGVRGNVLLSGS